MKQLLVFIRKEFYHVFRDRRTLLIMFGLPVTQILLFGYAMTTEVRNAKLMVLDNARDEHSAQIIKKLKASVSFTIEELPLDYKEVEQAFKKGDVKTAIIFPQHFGEDLLHTGHADIQIIADGSDPNTAKTLTSYISAIIADYQRQLNPAQMPTLTVAAETRMLYNEDGNGSLNFIPGVMALILMIVCTSLTSVSVVREKELGTMEVLLVSPFRPILVLIAKAVPFLVLSMLNVIMIVALSVFFLDIEIKGSLLLLFAESALFIITCLSFGLLISNSTTSQQTALLMSMMGMMLPTLIFTGFLFPLENMPVIFQIISNVVPAHWYYLIIKSVMLKGLDFEYVWKETVILLFMTTVLLAIALKNFKKRLE